MAKFVYADNAATTKLDLCAYEAMVPFLTNEYGNASQPYAFARNPKKAIADARQIVAECIGAQPEEIYFTSGGTESDNWAIMGVLKAQPSITQIITTSIEHHAILNVCKAIEDDDHMVKYLTPNRVGIVDATQLRQMLTKNNSLVSVMMANNEIGAIEPIAELAQIAHQKGAVFHTDAVQAVGHINVDVCQLGVDLLSASAHKFNGPKGVGFLYIKKGTQIAPMLFGGAQESQLRAGTENVAAIVGMAVALENNCKTIEETSEKLTALETILLSCLKKEELDFVCNSEGDKLPGLISLSFRNMDGESILHRLDLMGISVSTGAACDSVNTQVSHVLQEISVPREYVAGTIRISLGKYNTESDVLNIGHALVQIVKN